MPEAWRGVRDEALSTLTGIPGCIFCHASGFIGGELDIRHLLDRELLFFSSRTFLRLTDVSCSVFPVYSAGNATKEGALAMARAALLQ